MKNMGIKLLLLGLLWPLTHLSSWAQHTEHHGNSHSFHPHHLALFNGATTSLEQSTTAYTLGLDYEFRFSEKLGVGLLGEIIFAEESELIAGIPLFYHPLGGLKIMAVPMLQWAQKIAPGSAEASPTALFAGRIALGYDFHLGSFSLGPEIGFDLGETQSVVFGISIGKGF